MGAKLDLSDGGKNIGCGRSRSGCCGKYLHLREEISKRRWRDKRNEELHDLYCRWSNEGGREECACGTYRGQKFQQRLGWETCTNRNLESREVKSSGSCAELRRLLVDIDQFN
jgi:hypothetical protein